jgi:hypothetical protein
MSRRPGMAHPLYRINQRHIAFLYVWLMTSRSVTSMRTRHHSSPCKAVRLGKCSVLRVMLRCSPSPYARPIALQDLRTSMLPALHSSSSLPVFVNPLSLNIPTARSDPMGPIPIPQCPPRRTVKIFRVSDMQANSLHRTSSLCRFSDHVAGN